MDWSQICRVGVEIDAVWHNRTWAKFDKAVDYREKVTFRGTSRSDEESFRDRISEVIISPDDNANIMVAPGSETSIVGYISLFEMDNNRHFSASIVILPIHWNHISSVADSIPSNRYDTKMIHFNLLKNGQDWATKSSFNDPNAWACDFSIFTQCNFKRIE